MKALFTSAVTASRTLMAMIYIPLKSNLYQDYAVCLFLKHIFLILSGKGLKLSQGEYAWKKWANNENRSNTNYIVVYCWIIECGLV